MNSPHATIDVLWPKDAPEFGLRLDERLVERHQTVHQLIGANLVLPPDLYEEMDTVDQLVRSADEHSQMAWDELHDAFAPVRSLIEGDTALVPAEVYERLRASKARVISSVSVVEAASPWAFFAIEGTEWGAPRWVYLDDETADPSTDLAVIEQRLRARLAPGIADRPLDEKAAAVLTTFIERARKGERLLLPKKKQRALDQMAMVLKRYEAAAVEAGDAERARLVRDLGGLLTQQPDDRAIDLRAVADCWLTVIGPHWEQRLARPGRVRPLRIRDLDGDLLAPDRQIPTAALRAAFDHAPLWTKPLDKRIAAAIVGVPCA
jgi:hypothetical protein